MPVTPVPKPRFAVGDRFEIAATIELVDPNGGLPLYRLTVDGYPATSIHAGNLLLSDSRVVRCIARAPRPIAVGDRVRESVYTGTVIALHGAQAWVQFDDINGCTTSDVCDLIRCDI